jgi:hypothetical protein
MRMAAAYNMYDVVRMYVCTCICISLCDVGCATCVYRVYMWRNGVELLGHKLPKYVRFVAYVACMFGRIMYVCTVIVVYGNSGALKPYVWYAYVRQEPLFVYTSRNVRIRWYASI